MGSQWARMSAGGYTAGSFTSSFQRAREIPHAPRHHPQRKVPLRDCQVVHARRVERVARCFKRGVDVERVHVTTGDTRRFEDHYPGWRHSYDLERMLVEIAEAQRERAHP